ncbi:hypothetical protein E2320_020182 [Naja naja]|nr:hypothetical protein E2320_020182 [Naja naja]
MPSCSWKKRLVFSSLILFKKKLNVFKSSIDLTEPERLHRIIYFADMFHIFLDKKECSNHEV